MGPLFPLDKMPPPAIRDVAFGIVGSENDFACCVGAVSKLFNLDEGEDDTGDEAAGAAGGAGSGKAAAAAADKPGNSKRGTFAAPLRSNCCCCCWMVEAKVSLSNLGEHKVINCNKDYSHSESILQSLKNNIKSC